MQNTKSYEALYKENQQLKQEISRLKLTLMNLTAVVKKVFANGISA